MTTEEYNELQINDFIYHENDSQIFVFMIFYKDKKRIKYNRIYAYNKHNKSSIITSEGPFRLVNNDYHFENFTLIKDQKEIDKYKKMMVFS